MIPRVVHFVFGLERQREPFHFLHYVALESCRRVLGPETIYFHHHHVPSGPWWGRIRQHLTLVEVAPVEEVSAADYSAGVVPPRYRYAHHADFIRLDALIEHGGVYADIDTVFVRRFGDDLFDAPFVIGREADALDVLTNTRRPSLCNAVLMAEAGSRFAREWRARMPAHLDGTWSNHSGFLPQELSVLMPDDVRVEPESTFYPFQATQLGLARLLAERHAVPPDAASVHLWQHLWWDRRRRDFSEVHAGACTPAGLARARTTLADLVRPYLPRQSAPSTESEKWAYLSLDDYVGYSIAAERCIAALEADGLEVEWLPTALDPDGRPNCADPTREPRVVVAHLVPEAYPYVREQHLEAFLVGHTAWETDRLPEHWLPLLDAADLIVVPSEFNAATFAAARVSTPVAAVPHVAPQVLTRRSPTWADIPPETFVFYTVGEWTERKAVFKTVEAYLRAFSSRDPVLLVVKTSHLDRRVSLRNRPQLAGEGTTAWSLARLLARHADPPAVRLVTRPLSEGEMASLHGLGDCYVSLCRGEGWGLGAFDAAAYGRPVVTTGFGGHLDYLRDSPYLVRFDLVPASDPAGFPSYAPDQRWAEPDIDHAVTLLREIFSASEEPMALARAASVDIRSRYRPAAIAAAFRSAVDAHARPLVRGTG